VVTDPGKAEELLAQALRAQARNAPPPASPSRPAAGDSGELASEPGELPDFRASDAASQEQDAFFVAEHNTAHNPAAHAPLGPENNENRVHHLPPHYGLLSGSDAHSLAREHAALEDESALRLANGPAESAEPTAPRRPTGPPRLAASWILLLAALLGLAAGSVIGLLTLI
jgi:hypothetical protein